MKKPARITYISLRVLMAVVFVISVVGFILNNDPSVKSSYLFNCGQSALFLLVSFTPLFLKKLDLDIPDLFYIIFILFCLAHFLCGEILGFFARFGWWDSLLHTFSGMLITLLSFSVINLLNKANGKDFKLSLAFSVLFAFCIAVTIGVVWEVVEFAMDNMFGLNMQRAYVSTLSGERGAPLMGMDALRDTMKDLILDALGALIVCISCSIFVIKKGLTVDSLVLIKKRHKKHYKTEDEEHADKEVEPTLTSQDQPVSGSKTDEVEALETTNKE